LFIKYLKKKKNLERKLIFLETKFFNLKFKYKTIYVAQQNFLDKEFRFEKKKNREQLIGI